MATLPVELPPYVHSEFASCVRDAEGSFEERRRRLDRRLRQSMQVTKLDLIQRNIVQGLSVVRRGAHALEGFLLRRPTLGEMIASKRLPLDYVDKIFPNHLAFAAPERIERVSLLQLLGPPSASTPSPAPVPTPPAAVHLGATDPAMLAAIVVAMLSNDQHTPALHGLASPALGRAPTAKVGLLAEGLGFPCCSAQRDSKHLLPAAMPAGSTTPDRMALVQQPLCARQVASSTIPALWPLDAAAVLACAGAGPGPGLNSSRATGVAAGAAGLAGNVGVHGSTGSGGIAGPWSASFLTAKPLPQVHRAPGPQQQGLGSRDHQPPFVTILNEFCDHVLGK